MMMRVIVDQNMEDHRSGKKVVEEDNESLKRRISSHPLYGLMLQNHMNCLKVSGIVKEEMEKSVGDRREYEEEDSSKSVDAASELDHFMEAYCKALRQLREAIEEPQQETAAFINFMHSQLRDISSSNPHSTFWEPAEDY